MSLPTYNTALMRQIARKTRTIVVGEKLQKNKNVLSPVLKGEVLRTKDQRFTKVKANAKERKNGQHGKSAPAPILYNEKQACHILGVGIKTLLKEAYNGNLQYVRVGYQMRFNILDLERFIKKNEIQIG